MELANKLRSALRWSIATAAMTPRESETACSAFFFPVFGDPFTALSSPLLDDPQQPIPESACAKRSADDPSAEEFRAVSLTFFYLLFYGVSSRGTSLVTRRARMMRGSARDQRRTRQRHPAMQGRRRQRMARSNSSAAQ